MIELICEKINPAKIYVTALDSKRTAKASEIAALFKSILEKNSYDGVVFEGNNLKTVFETAC